MRIETYRDIQLIYTQSQQCLAIACDVSAGFGEKEGDVISISPSLSGYYAASVPLMELIAIGAKPISVVDTLGVEMMPTGQQVISGIRDAMSEAAVPLECLTGSTEDNIPTKVTSIGVTIVSEFDNSLLKTYAPKKGQFVYLVGFPKMGQVYLEEEVVGHKEEVMDIHTAMKLRTTEGVGHLLPIGSKGVGYELELLAKTHCLEIELNQEHGIPMAISAGPASCMLLTTDLSMDVIVRSGIKQPITLIGRFI